ncbi:MAG: 3-isopropylmalate dehydratase small subunit [Bacteroidetes bacterium]|nr:3-isopropylmalate dehydratase small subunit [Bacteroidota bacterium]
MAQIKTITSRVVPLLVDNIDTDQIIPARFLKATDKQGFGEKLFADWRYESDGSQKSDFPLNDVKYRGARILLAGDNFGCGSSREHAPWALTAFGFQAVISTSFADIFRSNAMKNGLLPVTLAPNDHRQLVKESTSADAVTVTIDLERQRVQFASGAVAEFPIDPFSKFCLLNGVDELEYLRNVEAAIGAYEAAHIRQHSTTEI